MAQQSSGTPPNHAGVRIPPPLLFMLPLLLAWLLQALLPLPLLPGAVKPLALLLLVAGAGLSVWSVGLFRRAQTSLVPIKPSTTLVIGGPYRLSRNPMYLGLLCLYLAAALWLNLIWALALAPILVVSTQRMVIEKEERYLERRFGEEYRQYKSHVRRWI